MKNLLVLASFFENPIFVLLILLLFFGLIIGGVLIFKKHSKTFKDSEGPKSDKEIAEEEVKRVVVDSDEEVVQKTDETKDDKVPSDEEILKEEMDRNLSSLDNEDALKQMEDYKSKHPEEEQRALKNKKHK